MIEEAYVSFEVAKLLRDKGFNEPTLNAYWQFGDGVVDMISYMFALPNDQNAENEWACPTQQMVMAWLREVYKIYVCISIKCFMPQLGKIDGYSACIWYKPEDSEWLCCYYVYPPKQEEVWDSHEAATEAAIKYCLENLI